ncbi:hypothetical protein [Geodermatophilus sp. DSM 44513]|uniref:hypothetical protein n=1 Tax=Geodermatophilus sp. DSM 44513 TaxID=1528104 RepID=UPI00126ECF78|nr:hypothetical protein [Geodermatophilus sp. DSM 44513]WNV76177.1 hypothetical protein RTG05_02615 [Geodermatophilus sp. DSM 44513]
MPLLGTRLAAEPWPALLWNGARLHRAGAAEADGLALVALAASPPEGSGDDVERALRTGLAVSAALTDVVGTGAVTGRPTTGVVAAAACAAVAGGTDPPDLDPVLDVAAALMVVRPPGDGSGTAVDAVAAGHCLAAGWLAPQVLRAGLVGTPGTLQDTVSTVTGRPAGHLRTAPVTDGPGAPVGPAGALLAGLR